MDSLKNRVIETLRKVPGLPRLYGKYADPRMVYKRLVRNRPSWQRAHWAAALQNEQPGDATNLGYRWGDPESNNDRLGDYRSVLEKLRKAIGPETCVLEIGSFGGKWTQHMKSARKIICVDLFEESFEFLRLRLSSGYNLHFYKTQGDELTGIDDSSVDLVFSMDSLVRAPRPAIRRYLFEINRVLLPAGRMLIHLPCDDSPYCVGMYFTSLSRRKVERLLKESGFRRFDIDDTTLKHGLLISAVKDGN